MPRKTDQRTECKERDVLWLHRIRNRAATEETRDRETHETFVARIGWLIGVLEEEIEAERIARYGRLAVGHSGRARIRRTA